MLTVKFIKIGTPKIITVIVLEFFQCVQKNTDGMANSADPDQNSLSEQSDLRSALFAQTCTSL